MATSKSRCPGEDNKTKARSKSWKITIAVNQMSPPKGKPPRNAGRRETQAT